MTDPKSDLLDSPKGSPLRIYAWSTPDLDKYSGCLKIGQTTRDVETRVVESMGQARYRYEIGLDQRAERDDGSIFTDHEVRKRLVDKGFEHVELEWIRCGIDDLKTVLAELRSGLRYEGSHHQTFEMRAEQAAAVDQTLSYYQSIWAEDPGASPHFLWNAKMRFGKTFAAYQLAKALGTKRVLVVTFKPAVADAWQDDLRSHIDFDGWQYYSATTDGDLSEADDSRPLVYFGSFQDLLGRNTKSGAIKERNKLIHLWNWDLVIFDEYHFGAWRERAKELFDGEDQDVIKKEIKADYNTGLDSIEEDLENLNASVADFLPITTDAYLYLSGTPFRSLAVGEFVEEQIFSWTYSDEQAAKAQFASEHPDQPNPYASLPELRLLTYQMPDELIAIASQGEFDEFDLNTFFEASGSGDSACFVHESDVQRWLDIIRGAYLPTQVDNLKTGTRPPFPYSDQRLLPYLQHSFWFLPSVASCEAMANLLSARHNTFWHKYKVVVAAGPSAGIGLAALPPVRTAIGSGFDQSTITLSCGKLTTGVTVPQWSSILMLRNLNSPETYFQAAFRVQSPWVIRNPNGTNPNEEEIIKPVCYVFDFAPTRALRQVAEYGTGLLPNETNPEHAVQELVNFLPVLAYDGSNMTQIDAAAILDIATSGTSATLLARKWESAILVNVDNDTLRKIMGDEVAMEAIMNIEGFRALGSNVFETVVNKSEQVKEAKRDKDSNLSKTERKQLTEAEKEYKSKRKLIQEKLIKFATRIPAFMYLTDYRENSLHDIITKLEPDLFKSVTGLEISDFELLVSLGVFNATHMNQAIFAFRRYEDASLSYTGIESHPGVRRYGLYDTVVEVRD